MPQRHAVPSGLLSKRPAGSVLHHVVSHATARPLLLGSHSSFGATLSPVFCPRLVATFFVTWRCRSRRWRLTKKQFHQSGAWHCPVCVGHALPSAAASSGSLRLRPSCAAVGLSHHALSQRVRPILVLTLVHGLARRASSREGSAASLPQSFLCSQSQRAARSSQRHGRQGQAWNSSSSHAALALCSFTRCVRASTHGSSRRSRPLGSEPCAAFLPEPLFGVGVLRTG